LGGCTMSAPHVAWVYLYHKKSGASAQKEWGRALLSTGELPVIAYHTVRKGVGPTAENPVKMALL
jgi:hypothetical protein